MSRKMTAWEKAQSLPRNPTPATPRPRGAKAPRWVAFFHDRPGQPLASIVVHVDRWCPSIRDMPTADIREATEEECARLPVCERVGGCGG